MGKMIHARKLEIRQKITDPRDGVDRVPLLLCTKKTKTVILLEKEECQYILDMLELYLN